DDAAVLHGAAELEPDRSARSPDAEVAIKIRALVEDDRHRRERVHVVERRRFSEETLDRRHRRAIANDAAFSFEALEESGLFAADVRARAATELEMERLLASANIVAQVAGFFCDRDRAKENSPGVRILGSQV